MKSSFLLAALLVALAGAAPSNAENWPRWRGPDGNAVSGETPLPVRWSTTENVRWKVQVPGEGFSSPIIWEDRVFVTSAFDQGARRAIHGLDFKTGRLLWSSEVRHKEPELASAMTGHAPATPATDGRYVVAFFGNAGVLCCDTAGKRLWHHELPEFESELGLASSPVIWRDRVFLVCDHDGDRFRSFDSFLLALDLKTGQPLWKSDRHRLYRSWSTPILAPSVLGKDELIVNAQEILRAYDPETGAELWRVSGMTPWVTPSPVFGHGLVFACSGKDGPTLAVRPGGKGDVTDSQVAWRHKTGGPYICSPVLYGDYLYVPTEQGILTCLEALSGKVLYRERLEGKFTSSPVAGDGKVYFTSEEGITFVVKAGPQFELLARNALEDYTLASPAISGGGILIRTEKHLYCVGAAGGK